GPVRGESARARSQIGIGRHRLRYHGLYHGRLGVKDERWKSLGGEDGPERWELFYRTPYTEMVGARFKRLRVARGLSQQQARYGVRRPRGGVYSQGLISRVEKGYADAPLYVYVHLAEAYEVDPGRVMGTDEAQKQVTEAEMTLIQFLREVNIEP